jgi:L,D-transpeptidase catalytic domain
VRFVPHVPRSLRRSDAAVSGRPRRFRLAGVLFGFVLFVVGAGLLGVRLFWPQARVAAGGSAFARVQVAPFGERIGRVEVYDPSGRALRVTVRSGLVVPVGRVRSGMRLRVDVTVRRVGWLGWLVGGSEQVRAVLRTPTAEVAARWLYPAAGRPVRVEFSSPVSAVTLASPRAATRRLSFARPRRSVPIGVLAAGSTAAGSMLVAGVAHPWESLPAPVRVSWFQAGRTAEALVRPTLKTRIGPSQPIVLTFSQPIRAVLGRRRPRFLPRTPGSWRQANEHTLVFRPGGAGFPLGTQVRLILPHPIRLAGKSASKSFQTLSWRVPHPSPLRLRQLLAQLGYLPLSFHPSGTDVPLTAAAQARAAVNPPSGSFRWRYKKTPRALKTLWQSSRQPTILRGALIAFQSSHHQPADGQPGPALWQALLHDQLTGKRAPNGYSYVLVSETIPQTLTLWQNGQIVLRTAVNTGIASRPTALGTYPVYLHLSSTTMSGTNPDGSHYADHGVPWVNYFNGGDAIHGFIRPGYGYPQSLGCVEAPIPTAAQIWPYVQLGTLITITA